MPVHYQCGYGGHSADLLFHIIISELQYIIPDSSPKILSWHEIYYLGVKYIYWAHLFILGTFIYSVRLCNKYFAQLGKTTLRHPLVNITHPSPPLDLCCSTSTNLDHSVSTCILPNIPHLSLPWAHTHTHRLLLPQLHINLRRTQRSQINSHPTFPQHLRRQ